MISVEKINGAWAGDNRTCRLTSCSALPTHAVTAGNDLFAYCYTHATSRVAFGWPLVEAWVNPLLEPDPESEAWDE